MLYESAAAIARYRGDHTAMVNGGLEDGSNATDLVVGSGLQFDALGDYDLKGVPGSWELFRLEPPATRR